MLRQVMMLFAVMAVIFGLAATVPVFAAEAGTMQQAENQPAISTTVQEWLTDPQDLGYADQDLKSPNDPRVVWPPKTRLNALEAENVVINYGVNTELITNKALVPLELDSGEVVIAWAFLENANDRVVYVDAETGEVVYEQDLKPDRQGNAAGVGQYNSFPWNWNLPFRGTAKVTQGYNGACGGGTHYGSIRYAIDLSGGGACSGCEILAPASGYVMYAAWHQGGNWAYGNQVIVEAGDTHQGNGGRYMYRVAHASGLNVRSGWWVDRGRVLGWVGTTGRSTGTHIHFNINRGGYAGNGGIWGDSFPPSWPPGVDGYNGCCNCWIRSDF